MAFVCTCDCETLDAEVLRNSEGWAVVAHLGYEEYTDVDYFCHVGLSEMPGGNLELYFYVRAINLHTKEAKEFWSGRYLPEIIDSDARVAILATVCTCIKALLNEARPSLVFWQTHDERPPQKALVKYERVAVVVRDSGYVVTKADEFYGKLAWWAERL